MNALVTLAREVHTRNMPLVEIAIQARFDNLPMLSQILSWTIEEYEVGYCTPIQALAKIERINHSA